MTSSERAEQIRDRALKAVADRITELGADFHPAAIPIVAANVAMHVMADELLDDVRLPDALVVGHVSRLTAWGPGERHAQAGPFKVGDRVVLGDNSERGWGTVEKVYSGADAGGDYGSRISDGGER